jgi:Xaa-Pro aminopeptidase
MSEIITAEFFAGNRARLRELFTGTAPIVVTANGLLQKAADSTYTFQQDSSFWYLTGINEPDVTLVLDKDKEYLIVPELSDYQHSFDGSIDAEAVTNASGIKTVLGDKDGWKQLQSRLKKVKHVATLAANPPYVETYGMYTNPARATLIQKIKEFNGDAELLDLRTALGRLRMVKQPVELATMQQAINLTVATLKKVKAKLPKLGYEYDIEAEVTGQMLRHGARDAWKPTVGAGANACVLHWQKNTAPLRANDMVVIDIGAEVNHYCADITRTYSIGGKPSRRQQAVYDAVVDVHAFACSLQKPHATIRENEKEVEQFMGEKLRELGLIKTIDREAVRHYFPHATSHYLGIDPHDAGDYEYPLEPGVVLTVEPGIYIPEEGIGVRLEDDILITAHGYKSLSERLPRIL